MLSNNISNQAQIYGKDPNGLIIPIVTTTLGEVKITGSSSSSVAVQTVAQTGTVTVAVGPATQTVTGSFSSAAVQTVVQTGTVTVGVGPASQTIAGSVTVAFPGTQTINQGSSWTVVSGPATQTVTGAISTGPATQTVTGAISTGPATQTVSVSGSVTATPVATQTIAVSSGTQTVVANAVGLFVTPAGSSFPVTPPPDTNLVPLGLTVSGAYTSYTLSNSSTYQSAVITIYGNTTWSATTTLAFEGSSDSSSYFPLPVTPLGSPTTSLVTVATGTTTGNYLANLGGLNVVRVRAVSFQAGDNVQVNYRLTSSKNTTYLNGSLPAGSNVIGGVTQSGTWTVATSSPATQTVTGNITNLPTTQTVTSAGGFFATTQTVAGFPATQTVTGNITNLPATQTVTSAGGFFATTQTIAGSVTVAAFPATQTVSVINTNAQPTYGTSNQSITCTINSLSTGSFTLSTAITNSSFQDILLAGRFVTGSSGVSGQGSLVIIGAGSSDGGTTWPLNSLECAVISVLSANANTYTVTLGSTAVAQAFGGYLPQQIKFGVLNNSGASLASSGNSLWYQAVNTQI